MTVISSIDAELVRVAERVVLVLSDRNFSIVTAESCTAGLIAAALSLAEGASTWLHGGFVTYTKEQKTAALGVSAQLLATLGSVNSEVVQEMAAGALARSPATMSLAVTGVLGPEKDEDGNPVGLVFFGCCKRGQSTQVVEKRFPSVDADRLRRTVVVAALELVEKVARASQLEEDKGKLADSL
jgi:nicotinamide-nucleotide amidase